MPNAVRSWIVATCNWLGAPRVTDLPAGIRADLDAADAYEIEELLNIVSANFDDLRADAMRWRQLMQAVAVRLIALVGSEQSDTAMIAPDIIVRLSGLLSEIDTQAAAHCLQILAAQGDEESIDALAAAMAENPPEDVACVGLALSPMWRCGREQLELFFDRLQGDYVHPATMSVLLDLANFATRQQRLPEHPMLERSRALEELLKKLTERLRLMETDPLKFGDSVEAIQRVLSESVALTVSLCDALGLIGKSTCIEALLSTLALSHRRVQIEAAGALARLGEPTGQERLVQLAADPVARLRAVAYSEELGLTDKIDEEHRTATALAEAELASWLAAPERFGIAPQAMELVDSRTQYWPSYEEPRDCYLFRYMYPTSAGQLSNIGISGPLTHAFNSDLANLPLDDIYAAFAGWHVEHDDIFEVPEPLLNIEQRREADKLIRSLEERAIQVKQLLALTFFFGEPALLATVMHQDRKLYWVADGNEQLSFPVSNQPTAMTPDLMLAIFRGRKLLRAFNR